MFADIYISGKLKLQEHVAVDQKESLKVVEESAGIPLHPLLLPCTFRDLQIAPSTPDTPPTSTTI